MDKPMNIPAVLHPFCAWVPMRVDITNAIANPVLHAWISIVALSP
jgi:hypothetical protein